MVSMRPEYNIINISMNYVMKKVDGAIPQVDTEDIRKE